MYKEIEFIQNIVDKVTNSWTEYSSYFLRLKMRESLRIIKRWYPKGNTPDNIEQILMDYSEKGRVETHITYGYMYYIDEVERFIKNPNMLWDFYDKYPNKKELFEKPFIFYSTNREENREVFLKEVFYTTMQNIEVAKMTPEALEKLGKDARLAISNYLKKVYSQNILKFYLKTAKEQLIFALQNVMDMLKKLCVLEDMRYAHNNIAHQLNLEVFEFSEDIPVVENGKIFGVDFRDCTIFQLEAMLCHYFNRLEKVREGIGKGLFAIYYFTGNNKISDLNIDRITDKELLECRKRYVVISCLYDKMHGGTHEMFREAERLKVSNPTSEEVYSLYLEKYEKPFAEVFGYIEPESELTQEAIDSFRRINRIYARTNSSHKYFDYMTKQSLMEDLIIQAERAKINWGMMKDDEYGYRIKRNILIGMDIPGLNMPLRVHYPQKFQKKVIHEYLQIDEIPLYVGQEDFDINGKLSGTQFLIPITPKQKKIIKTLSNTKISQSTNKNAKMTIEGKVMTEDALRRVKHINYIQLSNTAERLLSEKTNKSQTHPDYINIFTGKIRRTLRRNG